MKNMQRGFSLIELMIVIAVVGILASIAIPSYQLYIKKAKTAKLLAANQAGQLAIADYLLATNDPTCSNIQQPGSVPDGLQNFYYGTDSCYTMAVGWPDDFGDLFLLFYIADVSSDGSVTWDCRFRMQNTGADAPFAPKGCAPG